VTRLAAHNDVIALFIYDPLEARLPSFGKVIASRENGQLEVDTGDARFRKRFSEQFERELKNARISC